MHRAKQNIIKEITDFSFYWVSDKTSNDILRKTAFDDSNSIEITKKTTRKHREILPPSYQIGKFPIYQELPLSFP